MIRKIPDTVGYNAGLALSRYVPWPKDDSKRPSFFKAITSIKADSIYKTAFQRWQVTMQARQAVIIEVSLAGPLAVGLGNASPTEVGLALHRIYGMPVIPGSAIKGACSRAIYSLEDSARETAEHLFGTQNNAGYAIFHDAWYDPASVGGAPLALDTVTVHHPEYYQKKGGKFPTDFDDPIPVPFISVKPGTRFYFAIEIPDVSPEYREQWRAFVEVMLRHTITEVGLGGKTNAGYGWFKSESPIMPPSVASRQTTTSTSQAMAATNTVVEETWTNCELERREETQGRWSVRVRQGDLRAVISQGEWNKLPGSLPALQKGKRRTGNVRVRREGDTYRVVEVRLL